MPYYPKCLNCISSISGGVTTTYNRLTLQKATKQATQMVEGKMYILHDFSLKTTLTYTFFAWPAQSNFEKTSQKLNIVKKKKSFYQN
jgi:hypothetical protein